MSSSPSPSRSASRAVWTNCPPPSIVASVLPVLPLRTTVAVSAATTISGLPSPLTSPSSMSWTAPGRVACHSFSGLAPFTRDGPEYAQTPFDEPPMTRSFLPSLSRSALLAKAMSPCMGTTLSALPLESLNVRMFCDWSITRTCVPAASL